MHNGYSIRQLKNKLFTYENKIFTRTSVALLAACSGNNTAQIAYGTFEADETIVSAEASGKLLEITATEAKNYTGRRINRAGRHGPAKSQTAQLRTQREAVLSKKKANVSAQIDVVKEQLKRWCDSARIEKMFADKAAPNNNWTTLTDKSVLPNVRLKAEHAITLMAAKQMLQAPRLLLPKTNWPNVASAARLTGQCLKNMWKPAK
jgi:HlyD family secretion protein